MNDSSPLFSNHTQNILLVKKCYLLKHFMKLNSSYNWLLASKVVALKWKFFSWFTDLRTCRKWKDESYRSGTYIVWLITIDSEELYFLPLENLISFFAHNKAVKIALPNIIKHVDCRQFLCDVEKMRKIINKFTTLHHESRFIVPIQFLGLS